jgi:hypothetical protein
MFSYQISCNLWYSSNNLTVSVVRGDTPEGYALSPIKILWDFGVVCLNLPYEEDLLNRGSEEPSDNSENEESTSLSSEEHVNKVIYNITYGAGIAVTMVGSFGNLFNCFNK